MVQDVTTGFIARLRQRDGQAWFELWETFGPVIKAQLSRWGRGHIGFETVQDLSQETLAALATAIDTHDPSRGVRFSTWLLAIARYTLTDEFDRRSALKRGAGRKPLTLDGGPDGSIDVDDGRDGPDEAYEQLVFDAKIEASIRLAERECDFVDFNVFRMRVLEGTSGKQVAADLGLSEAATSRRLTKVRVLLREKLQDVLLRFSFTDEELAEATRNGLDPNPKKASDALFDEALAEVYARAAQVRLEPQNGPHTR